MNTIKCKYNWDEAAVKLLCSGGTTVALLCKDIEADLNILRQNRADRGNHGIVGRIDESAVSRNVIFSFMMSAFKNYVN